MASRPARPRLVVFGDSHVEATGPRILREGPSFGFDVRGFTPRRGWSTARYASEGIIRRIVASPEHGPGGAPDVVLVSLGGNDRPASFGAYRRQLTSVVEQIRAVAPRADIVWLGTSTSVSTPEADARRNRNAGWQAQVLPALGVAWIDGRPGSRTGHAPDGLHYTARGYDAWVASFLPQVRDALKGGGFPWQPLAIAAVAAGVFGATLALRGR